MKTGMLVEGKNKMSSETNAWVRVQEDKKKKSAIEKGEICPRCLQVLEGMGRMGSHRMCNWCEEEMRNDKYPIDYGHDV